MKEIMAKLAKVVLVGRKNVGKSTLFNRLSEKVKSIAYDFAGVTRDFLSDTVSWQGVTFELIDSGGVSLHKSEDPLDEKVRQLALQLIDEADLILFVVDAKDGLIIEDREINKMLFKADKNVLLVVNKADAKDVEDNVQEFQQLGRPIFPISAIHGKGIAELLEAIVADASKKTIGAEIAEPKMRITILGKPNVGKSSLMNLLLERERSIVSEIAGTTREAIGEPIQFYKETLMLTDTPGIRRKRGVTESLEQMMVKTAFRAVERSNIVLLMIDGSEGKISDQELKLAFYAFEQELKGLILLINKEDIIGNESRADLAFDLEKYEFFVKKIPMLFISCKTGKNIGNILPLVQEVWNHYTYQFSDVDLTMLFKTALERTPLYYQQQQLIFRKAQQIKTGPITIILKVNQPQFFGPSQLAFFENVLRKEYGLKGAPVKFIPRR